MYVGKEDFEYMSASDKKKDIGRTIINPMNGNVIIIVNRTVVSNDELEWRTEESGYEELTLNEISEQLYQLGNVIYVWDEMGLSGKIYQFGNYQEKKWHEHGTTKGFA